MRLYRIAKNQHIHDLSGVGARVHGGRWNHKGTSIIYASESRALATVEYLVHVPFSIIPTDLSLIIIAVPDEISPMEMEISKLPENWRKYPAPSKLAELGTRWATENESLLLRVPSAVIEHEFNVLMNPLHPDMRQVSIVQIESFEIDKRMLRRSS